MSNFVNKVYIQFNNNLPINPTAYNLLYGCQQLGLDVVPFRYESDSLRQFAPSTTHQDLPTLEDLKFSPNALVHGWVSVVHRALEILNIQLPQILDYPTELQKYFE